MNPPRHSPGLLTAVLLGHAGALLAMVSVRHLEESATMPSVLSVSLIEVHEEIRRPERKPQPPKPVIKPQPKQQVLAMEQPEISPAEQQQAAEPPKPVAEPVPVAHALMAEAPKPAPPPPLIEPRLDADYLDNPKPPYPTLSRRLGEQGTVQLRVFVNADGSVGKLELKRGSGHARLDQSAMNTVRDWRFVPARQGSQPVAAWVVVPIHFTLGS